jgi:hypothetical protein
VLGILSSLGLGLDFFKEKPKKKDEAEETDFRLSIFLKFQRNCFVLLSSLEEVLLSDLCFSNRTEEC